MVKSQEKTTRRREKANNKYNRSLTEVKKWTRLVFYNAQPRYDATTGNPLVALVYKVAVGPVRPVRR